MDPVARIEPLGDNKRVARAPGKESAYQAARLVLEPGLKLCQPDFATLDRRARQRCLEVLDPIPQDLGGELRLEPPQACMR